MRSRSTGQAEAEPYRRKVQAMLEEQCCRAWREHLGRRDGLHARDFRDRYLSPFGSGFSIEPRILQSAWFRPHNVSEEAPGCSSSARARIPVRVCRGSSPVPKCWASWFPTRESGLRDGAE